MKIYNIAFSLNTRRFKLVSQCYDIQLRGVQICWRHMSFTLLLMTWRLNKTQNPRERHIWMSNEQTKKKMSPVMRICVFEHSVMTNFNCACPAIQRVRDLAFCLKVPLDSLLVWASSEGSGETARMRRLAWTFDARIGDKYQIRLTRSICRNLEFLDYMKN